MGDLRSPATRSSLPVGGRDPAIRHVEVRRLLLPIEVAPHRIPGPAAPLLPTEKEVHMFFLHINPSFAARGGGLGVRVEGLWA